MAPPEPRQPTDGPGPAIPELSVVRRPWLGAEVLSYEGAPASVLHVLDDAVRRWPDRVWLEAPEGAFTYREVAELVAGAAAALADLGIGPGDRFAVAALNGIDIAVGLFAAARLGAVLVGLNTALRPPQWAYVLEHSGAKLVLAQPAFADAVAEAGAPAERTRPAASVLRAGPRPWDGPGEPDPAAAFAVVYTSGTTGRPKASQVVHRCSVHSALSYAWRLGLHGDDRTSVVFQLFYISALHAHVLPMALVGGTAVLVPEVTARTFLEVLERDRITWAYAVPSIWQVLLRDERFTGTTLPHLRLAAFGGSPMPPSAIAELQARLPGVAWHDVYGLSETHSPSCIATPDDLAAAPGSVGRPLPCMEAKLVDDELWLRGSLVTTGYFADPAATAEAITPDGWFRTGDVARIDAEGRVTILDRRKDMIQRGGQKVFSAEVEQVLRGHPAVADCAIVGTPDPVAFEHVVAFVVLAPGAHASKHDLRAWVREHLADHAVPRQVHLVGALPRNATGKLDKVALRADAIARQRAL